MRNARAFVCFFCILILFGYFFVHEAAAASLKNLTDIISTSRPSAASPLSANAPAGTGQLSIANNGSRFLASDSAKIIQGSGTVSNAGLLVSSQSTALTTVSLSNTTGTFAGAGADVLIFPVTARHTISFTTATAIPVNGRIVITFPGNANTTASPSASTFAFNGLVASNVTVSGATCSGATLVVNAPTITCTTASAVPAGTGITITVGSSTPTLINPTKTHTAGSADIWSIAVRTTDASGNTLDSKSAKIATIESVRVHVNVEPTLTFVITGVSNGVNSNTISSSCGSITTNAGTDTTATTVNLGLLSNGVSIAAQKLTVSTNAPTGYVITAASSGQFTNTTSSTPIADANGGLGLTANDTPAPATITPSTAAFGIHPCGARSNTNSNQWVNGGDIHTARFSNPWNTGTNTFYNTLASYSGPIANDNTAVVYGATISPETPAGIYQTTLTYTATATF